MKVIVSLISIVAIAAFAGSAQAACKPKPKPKPAPRVTVVVKKAAPKVQIDRVPVGNWQQERQGYCVNGKFMDMVAGQLQITDSVLYARFYQGVGITCADLPGFKFTGTYVGGSGIDAGNYAYFVR